MTEYLANGGCGCGGDIDVNGDGDIKCLHCGFEITAEEFKEAEQAADEASCLDEPCPEMSYEEACDAFVDAYGKFFDDFS